LHIDEISSTLAWIFDCYEKNIVTKEDLDGLSLEWGNQEAAVELIRKIAYREGIGDILAEGTYRAALKIGKNSLGRAITIKKTGVNEGNVRGKKAWALGIITSTRGGGHLCGSPNSEGLKNMTNYIGEERYGVSTAGQSKTYEGKAKLVTWFEKFKAIIDSLGVCYFSSYWQNNLLSPDDYAALFSKVIGKTFDSTELFKIGERIINIEKAFNTIHGGFSRKDDYPPQRFVDEPVKSGPFAGEQLPLDKWNQLLDEYYDFHGWDKETGWQTENILDKLQLTKIKEKLREEGRLIKK
jgi:aldehyde:ferredoxin oxidoreductase